MDTKICCTCKKELPLDEFWSYKKSKDGKQPKCKECQREYKKTPEYKKTQAEYNRIYYQIPEVKEAIREWKRTPEQRAVSREYESRPEVKARRKELNQTPRRKEYRKNYGIENRESLLVYRAEHPEKYLLCAARKRAKQFGVPFSLAEEDITIPERCPVLGVKIQRGKEGKWTNNSPSIDRIIPELGYVLGNTAVISYRANAIKKDGTSEEHRAIGEWILMQNPSEPLSSPPFGFIPSKTHKSMVYEAKKRSKKNGLLYTLRPENILIPEVCPILGINLTPGEGKPHDGSPSLDRVDPSLGYVPENCRVISLRANLLKRDGTAEEHLKIADWMESMLKCGNNTTDWSPENGQGF